MEYLSGTLIVGDIGVFLLCLGFLLRILISGTGTIGDGFMLIFCTLVGTATGFIALCAGIGYLFSGSLGVIVAMVVGGFAAYGIWKWWCAKGVQKGAERLARDAQETKDV